MVLNAKKCMSFSYNVWSITVNTVPMIATVKYSEIGWVLI